MTKLSRNGFVDKRGRQVSLVPVIPNSTSDNFASFKSDGTLQDSGKKATDFATANHNHNGVYSPVDHNHDEDYAAIDHNHSGVYSPVDHNHDEDYAAIDHNHSGVYAPATHEHSQYLKEHQDISGKVNKVTTATENHLAAFDASGGIKDSEYTPNSFSLVNHYHSELFRCKTLNINCTDSQTGKILTNPADGSGTDGLKPILIYIDNIISSHNVSLTNYRIPIIANFNFLSSNYTDKQAPAILEANRYGTSINIYIYFGTGTRLHIFGSLPSSVSDWQDAVFADNTYERVNMIDGVIN